MFDQENKTHVEQSTAIANNNNNKVSDSTNSSSTSLNNPLSDHDYCSPRWAATEDQAQSNALAEQIGNNNNREKRLRKEVHDPEFSQFTSSEYSSSDVESDQESEADSVDDPNRPWCTCEKPDDGKFMIECEICKYWFHGSCVGMTQALSKKREKEGREWFCSQCDHALQTGTPRNAIALRIVKKEKKKSNTKMVRRRGRPRKSESAAREASARLSLRSTRRSNSSADSNLRSKGKSNARVESFEKFDDQQRLKQLIRERKKDFFRKHRLSEQLKSDKPKEMIPRHSLNGSLGHSLDSVATNTSSPNMSNLPINIKSEHKERSKPNIVLQINTKKDGSSEVGGQRIVTTIVKKRKNSEPQDSSVNELFTADPIQLGKKSKNADRVVTPTLSKSRNLDDTSFNEEQAKVSGASELHEQQSTPKRKRKGSESSSINGSSKHVDSQQIHQKIKECLNERAKNLADLDMTRVNTEMLATEIVDQLNECYKVGSAKYMPKYRSLIFNLRKNQALVRNVLTGEISPSRLVRMSPDEMAPNELAKWRERENKHSIELIKRDAELAAQQVIVKKTHKGEEVIAAPAPNEPDDPTAAKEDQELPCTPTKASIKQESSKVSPSPTIDDVSKTSSTPAKNLNISFRVRTEISDADSQSVSLSEVSKDHDNKDKASASTIMPPISDSDSGRSSAADKASIKAESVDEPKIEQPKRLRVSIDTRLDPANLSRLTEPLIKPVEHPPNSLEYSPSRMSPNAEATLDNDHDDIGDEEDEELYDPETSSMPQRISDHVRPLTFSGQCWSGTITMSEVGKFNAKALPVSGNPDFMAKEISQTLMVCGRIAPDQVTTYIKKLKSTTKNQIFLVQLHPLTENDKASFDTFFDYLYTRNRCGVMNHNGSVLKDFYVLPIHEGGHIPEVLKPIDGPGLDRREPNCLLGLLVKPTRPSSSLNTSSSYTPSSIK